jgi:endonuclease YncB( thermonuclease family)
VRGLLRSGTCEVEPRGPDRYGRLVALVPGEGGGAVGLAMVAAGYAIALRPCPEAYHRAERRARAAGQGAWGRRGFVRPSRWRHREGARASA